MRPCWFPNGAVAWQFGCHSRQLVESLGIAEGDDVEAMLALARDSGLAFYDALIVASAIEARCDMLYSEDMQHGRQFGGLTVVNPFLEGAACATDLSSGLFCNFAVQGSL